MKPKEIQFGILMDNLPGAVYLCKNDKDFSMIYLNDQVTKLTGYEPSQFISKEINFPDIYFPEDVESIYREVGECLAAKKPFHLQYRINHHSGELRWIEEFGTGIYATTGELIYLEGYLQDITERKNSEDKLSEANSQLKKANAELDRFVYSVSHDLRSPLRSILGLLNLMVLNQPSDETKLLVAKMKERVDGLDHFIKDVALYAQNSRMEVEKSEVVLRNEVEKTFDLLRHMPETPVFSFENNIPADLKLLADKRRLGIVLNNLVANAIKYSDLAKRRQFVKVDATIEDTECLLTISDNGIGIEQQYQPRIFDMFFRASERSDGSGLGLYIARETVEKMGGSITLRSVPGVGATFFVALKT